MLHKRKSVAPFGPGLALAQPLTVPVVAEDGEHVADIDVGIAYEQPSCVAIRATHGEPLTGALLRSLAIERIVIEAAQANTYRVFRTRRGRYIGVYYSDAFDGMLGFGDDLEELRADVRTKRRTRDDAFLSEVAAVYRDAIARRTPPAKAVQERFGPTTPENARRWIALARKSGKLAPAPGQGRRGERAKRGSR
jgi:hypothetical protein